MMKRNMMNNNNRVYHIYSSLYSIISKKIAIIGGFCGKIGSKIGSRDPILHPILDPILAPQKPRNENESSYVLARLRSV